MHEKDRVERSSPPDTLFWLSQETFRILTETYEKDDNRKANIPVPPIIIIDDYDKFVPKNFTKPTSYIRFTSEFPMPSSLDLLLHTLPVPRSTRQCTSRQVDWSPLSPAYEMHCDPCSSE